MARSWWARELLTAMEATADRGRLGRGRQVARGGQVLTLRIEPGAAVGEVQGSQLRPFTASVRIRRLDEDAVAELTEQVRSSPALLGRVAAGALPEELGSLLVPRRAGEVDFDCTCPDEVWPCKHAAAVGFVLADHVDDHPMDVLTLRGIDARTLVVDADADTAPDPTGADDWFGDETDLPDLPAESFRAATDDLDPSLLRRALRAGGTDESVVIRALADLDGLYRRLR